MMEELERLQKEEKHRIQQIINAQKEAAEKEAKQRAERERAENEEVQAVAEVLRMKRIEQAKEAMLEARLFAFRNVQNLKQTRAAFAGLSAYAQRRIRQRSMVNDCVRQRIMQRYINIWRVSLWEEKKKNQERIKREEEKNWQKFEEEQNPIADSLRMKHLKRFGFKLFVLGVKKQKDENKIAEVHNQ
ncbi:MAG: hypothetical protein EZS28_023190 [Streblomastix strix]|uniref:Uncharacterized protein n=1 Tax=Streblomastix strix TaxID=222440 RepID=A0A5J4VFR3_9EUKA|nr:MAG: hypothetical protein EZS28_023190 [Streblomastix strix]